MKVRITPSTLKQRVIQIPPSKSMAHRAIVCASLAHGKSVITNLDYSVDIQTTINGMRQLGADIKQYDDYVEIEGIKNFEDCKETIIECNESGSTLRFFIPLFSLTNKPITFTGTKRLMERPQGIYREMFQQQGLIFKQENGKIEIEGKLKPQTYHVKGDVSSQFISGLCFVLPLLEQDSIIQIAPPFESRSYVDLTIQMMENFGVHIEFKDDNTLYIAGNQQYIAKDTRVEGDFSQLGFFAVLGALQGPLDCIGLNTESLQGDKQIVQILKDMGCHIEQLKDGYRFHQSKLNGCTIDLNNCPDLGPILSTCASYALGKTTIVNAGRLRIKESDRIAAMESELLKVGVDFTSTMDTITINGPTEWKCNELLHGHNDHRIVMALTIGSTLASNSIEIDDAQSIKKSYPGFFEDICKLGILVEKLDD
ncbi:3-phosphoshikimate 1-carboxyvinyltransferase [Anaerorhabdus sp.]|uniref:3-phosphoshikimate 1-carboxyvinyltransferase n=1 Tax=Anaerorhabdus sp. TaxID=1872524 RepID=UPI002FC7E611